MCLKGLYVPFYTILADGKPRTRMKRYNIYLFTSLHFPHDCASATSRRVFFSPRRVSTSRYLVTLAGRKNRIRIIAEQRGTVYEREEKTAYCRGVTDQSESPRHDSASFSVVRSLARSLASRSLFEEETSKVRYRARLERFRNSRERVRASRPADTYAITRAYPFFRSPSFYLSSPGSTFFIRLARARVRFRFCFA